MCSRQYTAGSGAAVDVQSGFGMCYWQYTVGSGAAVGVERGVVVSTGHETGVLQHK